MAILFRFEDLALKHIKVNVINTERGPRTVCCNELLHRGPLLCLHPVMCQRLVLVLHCLQQAVHLILGKNTGKNINNVQAAHLILGNKTGKNISKVQAVHLILGKNTGKNMNKVQTVHLILGKKTGKNTSKVQAVYLILHIKVHGY